MEGEKYLIALNHFERFGPRRLKRLSDFFGSWQEAWRANSTALLKSGLKQTTMELFLDFRAKTEPDQLLEKLEKKKIKFATLEDSCYPPLLREIYAPPPIFYYKGKLEEDLFISPIAVVGTRKSTTYGKMVCEELVANLARSGLMIVSGLALGIDTLAHTAALEANGATTAVLGCGPDEVYPRTNTRLAQRILETGGCLISEFPPETPPFKTNFPRRNRLIAGMTAGTIVIEAGEKSGALITARYALEEGRDVFAIPGSIYAPTSVGPNNLIKLGAKPVTTAEEVLDSLGLADRQIRNAVKKSLPLTTEEEIILKELSSEPRHANELARATKLDINLISSRLTIMEMKGTVKHLGRLQYIRHQTNNL